MLSREVHTSLRGSGMATVIRPFSLAVLRHRGDEPVESRTLDQRSAPWSRTGSSTFLVEGGFPETQGLDAALRVELLQGYVDTVLFRDVVERHGVSQVAALRWLVRQCLRNPAGCFSVHRFYLDLQSQGTASRRTQSTRCGAPARRLPADRRAGRNGLGAAQELESPEALSGGPGADRGLRSGGGRTSGTHSRRSWRSSSSGDGPRSAT